MMKEPTRYYALNLVGKTVTIDIFGDITSWPWYESDMSAYRLSRILDELEDVDEIVVNINSYGGEVSEGLAIYNSLKNSPAKVVTRCVGFACSAASVIFMAGEEREMCDASLLMIHNAWWYTSGNAEELRKQADDLDIITSASKQAYLSHVNIDEEKLTELMDAETWIKPSEAVEMGFATSMEDAARAAEPGQSARRMVFERVSSYKAEASPAEEACAQGEPAGSGSEVGRQEEPPDNDTEPKSAVEAFFEMMLEKGAL